VIKLSKAIVFTTDIDEVTARKFDKIAEKNLRSRAAHLEFVIRKEIEFHEDREGK
jgi:hypothetical protein